MRVFGYGSLVNRLTHSHAPALRHGVEGWRREWVHTASFPRAILSARPAPGTRIDGLSLPVAEADRPALLAREQAYDAVTVEGDLTVFSIPPGKHPPADAEHPILLSYLDVVVQGYLAEFGAEGVAAFFATTDGWTGPILADRDAPVYPRHQRLSDAERALTDRHVAALGLRLVAP